MDKNRRITYLLVALTLCLAAWAASAMPRRRQQQTVANTQPQVVTPPPVAKTPPPRVEVVFALDTTGSMSGLIEGAKRKIWMIAQYIANGQPKPDLRVGLVAYRDKGDEYVTRFYDLSDDLDQLFEHLSALEAAGGGDTPEHVAKALDDAVNRTSWTVGQAALKQIYLVGDAPPHTDYNDGLDYRTIARHAHELGIHINTIRCGNDRETQVVWNEIASAAAGEYASIDQSGGMASVTTPFDDKLAELNAKLVGTAIGYGAGAGRMRSKAATSLALPKSSAADRASYFGLKGDALDGEGDLVADFKKGKVDPAKAPTAGMPAPVAAMEPEARRAYVEAKKEEREKITAEINALSAKRNAWLVGKSKPDAFDSKVRRTIEKQAGDEMHILTPKF
jgi:Mg-chelatase subunit ChlD